MKQLRGASNRGKFIAFTVYWLLVIVTINLCLWDNFALQALVTILLSAIYAYGVDVHYTQRSYEDQTANLESMVSEQTKKLELALLQAQEATKAKSEFIVTMSHEIRTLMNGVLGMAELLSKSNLSAEQQELVHVLHYNGQFLMAIINDILDFSKIESGKLELEKTPYSLSTLLNEVKNTFAMQANAHDLQLTLNYPKDLPELVLGDTTRLRQVFFNLISNAIKFTREGEIAIKVTSAHEPDMYQATISDTGVGMKPEVQAKLFSAFTQANASIARQYGGSGLGLLICDKLVKLMQGRIWIESEENKGSSFHFTFFAPEVRQMLNANPTVAENDRDISYLKVLVVEDNSVNRFLAVKLLNKLGIKPDTANDGFQALQYLGIRNYDVILMDLQMPNMDGLTAARQIRANTKIRQPNIIALTANAFVEDRAKCHAAGMDIFLSKPLNMKRLLAALMQVS